MAKETAPPQPMNIVQKLARARMIVREKGIKKTGKNDYAKYSYFTLKDILDVGVPAMDEVGLLPLVNFHEGVPRMEIYDCDSKEVITIHATQGGTASLKGCHSIQNVGAAQTYYRRFLWMNALEIEEVDIVEESEPDSEKLNFQIKDLLADIRKKLGEGGTKSAPAATKKAVQEMFGGNWQSLAQCKDPSKLQAILKTFEEEK